MSARKGRARRALLFIAMVAAGLLAVVLLSDPFERRARPVIHDLPAAAADGKVTIRDAENKDTLVSFPGELTFDVPEEVPDGPDAEARRAAARPAYRVHIQSGQPDTSGAFLATKPTVSLLDMVTGEVTGTLTSDEARFETGTAIGGNVAIDFTRMDVRRFSLMGHVEGDFPVADGAPAHMTAQRLDVNGDVVTGPGFVTWSRPDMRLDGIDMTWKGDVGSVDFRTDAHLELDATAARKGLKLAAAGGMTWTVPPDAEDKRTAAHGELRGRVTGTASDGSTLETDRMLIDGPSRTLTLLGPSTIGVPDPHAPLTLRSDELVVHSTDSAQSVSSTEKVEWSRPGMSGHGTGLQWDKQSGHLHLDKDVQLDYEPVGDPQARAWQLSSEDSLDLTTPPGAADPRRAAHGEMSGRVSGTTADGSTLQTEHLEIDGPTSTVTLTGPSTVGVPDSQAPLTVSSTHLVVQSTTDGAQRVRSDEAVEWSRPGLSGRGTGLDWDKQTGHLHFDKDVKVDFTAEGEGPQDPRRWQLSSDGSFDWTAPPDSKDPLHDGRGEVHGNVRAETWTGRLQTEILAMDGPAGTVALQGPSSWERHTQGESFAVSAGERIAMQAAPDGSPQRVQAQGDAQAWLTRAGDAGGPTHIAGAALVMDRPAREYSATGNGLVERAGEQPPLRLTAADRILVRTDEQEQPRWVEADGGVACSSGEYEVHGDSLRWDMVEDNAVLSGHCRLLASGAWMSAERVELAPRAQTFRILRGALHVRE